MSTPSELQSIDAKVREASISPRLLFFRIEDRLLESENIFRQELASPVEIVEEIGRFVAQAGGKRVRPALHLLTARMLGYAGPHDVSLAAVLEYIHCATLIHDDIIDHATTRRGQSSVHFRWGNPTSVLFGDYLYAKAMKMALRAGSLEVMDTLADVTLNMVEGELLQTRYNGRIDLTREMYLDLVERKTSEFFAACCDLAGTLVGVSEDDRQTLASYGRNLGTAFQLVDDLLDVTGDSRQLGKPAGADLREGKVTLPYLIWLQQDPCEERKARIRRQFSTTEVGQTNDFEDLRAVLEKDGALAAARDEARRHAEMAQSALSRFPRNEAREALEALPELLLSREA